MWDPLGTDVASAHARSVTGAWVSPWCRLPEVRPPWRSPLRRSRRRSSRQGATHREHGRRGAATRGRQERKETRRRGRAPPGSCGCTRGLPGRGRPGRAACTGTGTRLPRAWPPGMRGLHRHGCRGRGRRGRAAYTGAGARKPRAWLSGARPPRRGRAAYLVPEAWLLRTRPAERAAADGAAVGLAGRRRHGCVWKKGYERVHQEESPCEEDWEDKGHFSNFGILLSHEAVLPNSMKQTAQLHQKS